MTTPLGASHDEQLVKAALADNDEAFAMLVSRHKGKVFRTAARFTRDFDELDDLCQEVFIKAYENLDSFRNRVPFEHWLARITVHACYDMIRRKRRQATTPLDSIGIELADPGGEAAMAAEQARSILEWAMSRLSPQEQLVITLLELEEHSVKEIAALTGWSENNVKVKAHRARQALRQIVEASHER
jgi:RNA polymerase sigma-70 factor (ECF subfamily)